MAAREFAVTIALMPALISELPINARPGQPSDSVQEGCTQGSMGYTPDKCRALLCPCGDD
jgi:hypothetical protein